MIELKHISKIFPTADGEFQALTDVSLTIPTGDIFGIVGMSGAGKSTLVRCINLLERPTTGQVLIDGLLDESGKAVDLCTLSSAQLRKARRGISMIFQQFNLLMQRTCLDNICFPMEIAGVSKAKARERARELLDTVGFTRTGISHSSLAAKMMSSTARANGGGVPSGSLVSNLQSKGKGLPGRGGGGLTNQHKIDPDAKEADRLLPALWSSVSHWSFVSPSQFPLLVGCGVMGRGVCHSGGLHSSSTLKNLVRCPLLPEPSLVL